MASYATKTDVQEIVGEAIKTDMQTIVDTAINKAVSDLSEIIANFAHQVDARFNENEVRIANIEHRLERIEERLDGHDQKYQHLLNTLDTFIGRLDRTETEQLARDSQFNRLLEWAHKVSKKTGIPLKNL